MEKNGFFPSKNFFFFIWQKKFYLEQTEKELRSKVAAKIFQMQYRIQPFCLKLHSWWVLTFNNPYLAFWICKVRTGGRGVYEMKDVYVAWISYIYWSLMLRFIEDVSTS